MQWVTFYYWGNFMVLWRVYQSFFHVFRYFLSFVERKAIFKHSYIHHRSWTIHHPPRVFNIDCSLHLLGTKWQEYDRFWVWTDDSSPFMETDTFFLTVSSFRDVADSEPELPMVVLWWGADICFLNSNSSSLIFIRSRKVSWARHF